MFVRSAFIVLMAAAGCRSVETKVDSAIASARNVSECNFGSALLVAASFEKSKMVTAGNRTTLCTFSRSDGDAFTVKSIVTLRDQAECGGAIACASADAREQLSLADDTSTHRIEVAGAEFYCADRDLRPAGYRSHACYMSASERSIGFVLQSKLEVDTHGVLRDFLHSVKAGLAP